ncbi:MAG: patatin-like phospholipase family protein, partial [Microthrixaceae bacterium]
MSQAGSLLESLPKPIGFVLGGGGSLGAQQVGQLQALGDAGIYADLVVGTSIGSVNGAVVAADPIGAASRLSHQWRDMDPDSLMGKGWLNRIAQMFRRTNSVLDTPQVAQLIAEQLGDIDISELALPYAAMAVDVEEGRPVRLGSGRLVSAIEASTAVPGAFPMINRGGRLLCDGGIITNVGVLDALEMGAKSLVVMDCMFAGHTMDVPKGVINVFMWAFMIQLRQQVLRDLPIAAESMPVLYLPGAKPIGGTIFEFDQTGYLISDAYDRSRTFLDTVAVDGPGLYS